MKKTRFFNSEERKWVVIDARDKVLGRLSCQIARILQGKNKPTYTPNFLCGDKVIVINADHIRVTGNKAQQKVYDKYSGYPSGRKEITYQRLAEKNPTKVLYLAVKRMLPKNWLGKRMARSLKIYPGQTHLHEAQKPENIEV
ncbi:MAG: 50S ribosomal protein L13 [Candidatus Omnitrophica bacterium]|nr:50S ribosomal protein L13 [Candidatus Omnitrophota bacterium]